MQKSSKTKRLLAGIAGVVLALAVAMPAQAALSQSQVDSIISLLQSFGADSTTISNVRTSLEGGTPSSGSGSTSGGSMMSYTFTRNLTVGDTGTDVQNLQKILNADSATQIAASGVGSPGQESTYFGSMTKAAVIKFQNKYASEVLAPVGLSSGTGYVGAATRAKLNSMSTGSTGGTVIIPPSGGTLAVSAASQPSPQLAPYNATRVPFTNFTLTAGSSDVVVNSVTVERVGPGQDVNFAGVVLVNMNTSEQIGLAKTLNSNHQANIGEPFTVKAGTSVTLTVAGNMNTQANVKAGEAPTFSVVAINTSSPVSGALPIIGTAQTINATLLVGSVSQTISYDPGSQSKSIGTTNYKYATIRLTASAEDIRVRSIRWNQSGSASPSDLGNVMVEIDGVKYPTTVSSDGKYYSANLGSGIVIAKGFSKEFSVVSDILGGPNRTIQFDIYRTTDVYLTGQTYGFGIAPSAGSGSVTSGARSTAQFTTGTPWFEGATVTVQAGTVTTIGKATEVASQNIAVNVPNQVLGGFVTDFVGEPVTISGLTLYFNFSSQDATGALLTNVTIVDQNGAVVGGPKDASDDGGTQQSVALTDSITFPIGRKVYTIKGTIDPDVTNGQTLTSSTTPSGWSSPVGQNTGNTVTISQGNFTMNSMTVRTATTSLTMSTQPVSQNIVAGGQDITFANLQLDASQSGEDTRLSNIKIVLTGTVSHLSGCQLFDGATALNTGSNVPSSLAASGSNTTFTFDSPFTIPKGTVKTITLKCDVSASASGDYVWSLNTSSGITGTGVTSSNSVTISLTTGTAGTMSVTSGSLAVSVDASSPSYTIAAGGTSGVTMGVYKLRASNEPINLTKLGLKLTNTASSSATDLITVTIWDGATQVGTAVLTGSTTTVQSILTTPVNLPKDTDKTLTIKANLADIGSSQPGTEGHLIAIDPNGAEGSGVESGTTITSGASAGVAGIRVFNTFPTLALDTLPGTGVIDGRLMRFKVTANSSGPVGLYNFAFKVASTTGVTVTNVALYGYTDSSYSQPISGQGTGGQIGSTDAAILSDTAFEFVPSSNQVTISAGSTYFFELRATVSGVDTGDTLVTTLLGDSAYNDDALGSSASGRGFVTTASLITASTYGNFVWSPNATTTAAFTANDWTNGYGVNGLPAAGLIQARSN